MYSLLVSHQAEDRSQGTFEVPRGRFLEYTDESIATQLASLSLDAMDCIKSWPCLLMQEGRGQEAAYIREITAIEAAASEVKVTLAALPRTSAITNDALWKLRDQLDIGQFEFTRNHWAIKDRELPATLAEAGHLGSSGVSRFERRPLPAPSRPKLIDARDTISDWSHAVIDDFLLEAGVSGLAAGRDVGSRRDRANAIIKFAIENPAEHTAENSLLSAFIVTKASLPVDVAESRAESDDTDHAAADPLLSVGDEGARQAASRSPNRVFVVHGQNESARADVMALLSRVGLVGIVLHEQPSMGRHLLTKFIEEAELATFAIVLMTDDDVGGRTRSVLNPRARQNVILELGYFLSHLGQQRVCALVTPGLETPSDFDGIVYIRMDDDRRWETELVRELRAAKMPLTEQDGD